MKNRNQIERQGRELHPPYQAVLSVMRKKAQANAKASKHKSRL